MDLLTIKSGKGARHKSKRVGRGNGSGHGTFCCRGMNGQNSRSGGNRRPGFEGGQTPFIQRMPKLRGFKNPNYVNYYVLNVKDLEVFDDGSTVDKLALFEKGLLPKKSVKIKLLGDGELTKKLNVTVESATKSAENKIKKAKGSLTVTTAPKKDKAETKEEVAETPAEPKKKEPKAEAPAEATSEEAEK